MYLNEQQDILARYLQAVFDANKVVNLTSVKSFEEGMILHVEDSLAGLEEVNAAPVGALVDLGSGGGFPGVPLAVATGRDTLLVDSTAKKMSAIEGIIKSLGISGVSTSSMRIEKLAEQEPGRFAVATARALAALPSLLELAAPLLQMNGQLIAYKGPGFEEELERAKTLETKLGMKLVKMRSFTLSDQTTQRTILVFEKDAEPRVALPRRIGVAQKRPYA